MIKTDEYHKLLNSLMCKLHHINGVSVEELGALHGCTRERARQRIAKANTTLKLDVLAQSTGALMLNDKFVGVKEVLKFVDNVSVSTLYRWMDSADFPRPVKLGPQKVGWRTSTIAAWGRDVDKRSATLDKSVEIAQKNGEYD